MCWLFQCLGLEGAFLQFEHIMIVFDAVDLEA